jgi:hypothetical protein
MIGPKTVDTNKYSLSMTDCRDVTLLPSKDHGSRATRVLPYGPVTQEIINPKS